jgi:hypothetical protein
VGYYKIVGGHSLRNTCVLKCIFKSKLGGGGQELLNRHFKGKKNNTLQTRYKGIIKIVWLSCHVVYKSHFGRLSLDTH